MADNVTLPGTGELVATDDVGGRQYQRIKVSDGQADSETHARVINTNADADTAGLVARIAPQNTWSVSFTRVNASALDSPEMTLRRQGTGVTVSQSAGNLVVAAGTTANSEFLARSTVSFNGALIQRHQTILSQRIANNNFAVMLADRIGEGLTCTINSATSVSVTLTAHGFTAANIGQSMFIGGISGAAGVPGRYAIASIPDVNTINFTVAGWPTSGSATVDLFGWNYIRWLYTGATATNANVDSQRYGWNSGDTIPTINSTATPGHMAQTTIDGRNVYFQDGLVASAATPTLTARAHRWVNIPDQNVELFLYLWSFNGSTAPGSGTTWTVGFVSVEDTVNLPIYLAGIRPLGLSQPLPVVGPITVNYGTGTFPVSIATNTPVLAAGANFAGDVGIGYRPNAANAASQTNFVAAASTNATVLKSSAGRLIGYVLTNNATAVRYVKLHNQNTTPTAGTGVVGTIGIPPNGGTVALQLPGGIGFGNGITFTTVTGAAATDATAVAANDIVGTFYWL